MSLLSSRRYLSIDELAQVTSISKRTLYRWAEDRKIPGMVKLGGRVVFRESEIQRWLDEAERRSSAGSGTLNGSGAWEPLSVAPRADDQRRTKFATKKVGTR